MEITFATTRQAAFASGVFDELLVCLEVDASDGHGSGGAVGIYGIHFLALVPSVESYGSGECAQAIDGYNVSEP